MGLIREPEGVDFVIEPHNVTEEDHLAMLAFIAVCKDRYINGNFEISNVQFMKRANYLLMTLMLIITSCSGIRRYTTYYPYKENKEWSSQRVNYWILNLNYDTDIITVQTFE